MNETFEQYAPDDAPPPSGHTLVITYKGDVTETLKASGSACPFRLNENGDTEQLVSVGVGIAAKGVTDSELERSVEQEILDDAKKNGEINSYHWINLPMPKETIIGYFGKGNRQKPRTCVLCGGAIAGYGNNPAPLRSNGRCCDECNATKVTPERVYRTHVKDHGNKQITIGLESDDLK